uniref:Putative secreted protein n=1 Tax=Lutzomyia longipalpis TaxID=7200 RepID=A0A7G3AMM7_LUTLO
MPLSICFIFYYVIVEVKTFLTIAQARKSMEPFPRYGVLKISWGKTFQLFRTLRVFNLIRVLVCCHKIGTLKETQLS